MNSEIFFGHRAGRVTQMINLHQGQASLLGSTTKEKIISSFQNTHKGIFLFSPRLIRKIIRFHRDNLSPLSFLVPHTEEYILSTSDFKDCLQNYFPKFYQTISWNEVSSDYIILLALPSKKKLKQYSIEYFASMYWGYLFHGHLHRQYHELHKKNQIDIFLVQELIQELGTVAFDEIREVLYGEGFLFNLHDDQEVFLEFIAYYLQLYYFHPKSLPHFFPALKEKEKKVLELFSKMGIDEELSLKWSRPPFSVEIQELKEQRDSIYLQSFLTNVFTPKYHLDQILTDPILQKQYSEEQVKEFARKYTPLIKTLVAKILDKGKIHGELDFLTLRNLAIRQKLDLENSDLMLLDEILKKHFGSLYEPAHLFEKIILTCRSGESISLDQNNKKRLGITEATIQEYDQIIKNTERTLPSFSHYMIKASFFLFLYYVTFGWILLFFIQRLSLAFPWALKIMDSIYLKQFQKYYDRALLEGKRNKMVWAMMNLRKSQCVFEKIYYRYPLESANNLHEKLEDQFSEYVNPLSGYFIEQLKLDSKLLPRIQELLTYLVHKTSLGSGGIEGDLLLDFENAYIESTQEFQEISLSRWILSRGKKNLRIPLVDQEKMRCLKHLKLAKNKLSLLKLSKKKLQEYQELVHLAYENVEKMIRGKLGSTIREIFESQVVELKGIQEKIAFRKIQEEILDTIIERGHSHFTDLRDILSRNRLKLEDLTIREILSGDNLLKIDKQMSKKMYGIHSSAELYLRFLQLISSIFFGTPIGRFISKSFFIPVGGAVILLVILNMLVHPFVHKFDPLQQNPILFTAIALGLFIYITKLRQFFLFFFWKPIKFLWNLLFKVNQLLPLLLKKILIHPALGGGLLLFGTYFYFPKTLLFYKSPQISFAHFMLLIYGSTFIIFFTLLNTRIGIKFTALVIEIYSMLVQSIGKELLLKIFHMIIRISRSFLQKLEHFIYVVKDYLRLIQGEKTSTSILKSFLFLLWVPFAYFLSFYIILFIEPQINPLKFPAVSISYKILLVKPELYAQILDFLTQCSVYVLPWSIAKGFAWFTAFVITGVCGFLAWELQENWKLYKHNAKKAIHPIQVGSHGETMSAYLQPGFHSGTIPALFRKFRQATAKAEASELNYSSVLPIKREMKHIQECLENFLRRDFLLHLEYHPLFEKIYSSEVLQVEITSNTINFIGLLQNPDNAWKFKILLENKKNYIVASFFLLEGSLQNLSEDQQRVFAYLLAVFYKKAGVHLVEEELEILLSQMYPEFSLDSTNSKQMHYYIESEYLLVTFKQKNLSHSRTGSKLLRMKKKLRLSSFWKSSKQKFIPLHKILFSRHLIEWKNFDQIYEKETFSLGTDFLFLLDKGGFVEEKVIQEIQENMENKET